MMLIIPQLNGRDLDDLDIVQRDGAEWIRFGSYMHQPLASVPVLPSGATDVVTIGPEGYAEWRAVASDVTPVASHHYHDRRVAPLRPGIHDRGERKRKRCGFPACREAGSAT